VLTRDKAGVFRLAPLQGETAREHLDAREIETLNTVVLVDERGQHRRSAAVVRILWRLGGFWKFAGAALWLLPRPLRDVGYKLVAANRYRLFGKKETCRLPTAAERERFLP
jgi:predicted DCC family thiol-disulfide oxidoreductase YuxK